MPSNASLIEPKAMSSVSYTLYYGTFIHTPSLGDLEICFNTLVGVTAAGDIDFIHKNYRPEEHDYQTAVQFFINNRKNRHFDYVDYSQDPTKFFMPGFIDTHIHASQFPNIGIGLDCPLLDWLNDYTFPLENKFTDSNDEKLKFAKNVYSKVIQKTLTNGTTCASYFTTIDPHTTNLFAELLLEIGQRGFVGKVCMDHNDTYHDYEESFEDCVDSMNKIIERMAQLNPAEETLVKPIITPRFAPVCSRKMLKWLGKLSVTQDLPIQTHISENKKEIELVHDMFPDCEDYATVYDKHNLLNSQTILAHAIHLTKKERKMIREKKCSISHCPTSNTFISSGEAPIKQYLYNDKINVSLGTDVSGGFDSSILGIIKHCILVSHHLAMKTGRQGDKLTIIDAIYMATQGGAKAVGMPDKLGSFELGKKFDVQLIDLDSKESNVDTFEWQLPTQHEGDHKKRTKKMEDLLGKWIFSGDDRNCVKVWCNGRLVINKMHYSRDDRWVMVEKDF
ncbi:guanine deaminase [Scheffersomyces xylosifermentans]|uniref:guanine deaminase n=1 Tax=Scheffersomyces xylosifermentans TaxID=1304137 RepID=UPI00315CADEB